mmetsp:Transcript_47184/g.102710  ORF Transcript_47184/g.102710 Transcript_47184/m.102710 type:complete len:200 (-) Transcript_47184:94-693(-)
MPSANNLSSGSRRSEETNHSWASGPADPNIGANCSKKIPSTFLSAKRTNRKLELRGPSFRKEVKFMTAHHAFSWPAGGIAGGVCASLLMVWTSSLVNAALSLATPAAPSSASPGRDTVKSQKGNASSVCLRTSGPQVWALSRSCSDFRLRNCCSCFSSGIIPASMLACSLSAVSRQNRCSSSKLRREACACLTMFDSGS